MKTKIFATLRVLLFRYHRFIEVFPVRISIISGQPMLNENEICVVIRRATIIAALALYMNIDGFVFGAGETFPLPTLSVTRTERVCMGEKERVKQRGEKRKPLSNQIIFEIQWLNCYTRSSFFSICF